MQKVVEIYGQVFSMLRKNPTVLVLFFWIGILDAIALAILFLSPSPPVSDILAPIIRTFWSERYLHYPDNFLLLPKLFGHAHFLISTIFGVFISGVVIKKIEADSKGERISTIATVRPVLKSYVSLVIAWLISYGAFILMLRITSYVLPKNFWIQISGAFILGLVVQSLVGFLLPAIIIANRGFFRATGVGFKYAFKNLGILSGIFFIPMLIALLVSFAKLYTPVFVQTNPDLVLWVLAGGILVSLAVDILITSSATLLFLKVRPSERS